MKLKEKMVSAITILTCLSCYWLAKTKELDTTPFTMIGGFVGAIIGETIAQTYQKNKDDDSKKP